MSYEEDLENRIGELESELETYTPKIGSLKMLEEWIKTRQKDNSNKECDVLCKEILHYIKCVKDMKAHYKKSKKQKNGLKHTRQSKSEEYSARNLKIHLRMIYGDTIEL